MPLLHKGIELAARRMPKVISPGTHAVLDYAIAGSFLLMAVRYWKRNKRASMGSMLCAGAIAANSLLTDYPGGISPVLTYKNHGRVDGALAGLTAALPRVMGFEDMPEAGRFGTQALTETCVMALTDYDLFEQQQSGRGNQNNWK